MAYVYRHIRLDTGMPFYVGVGSDEDGKYKRAHSIQNRNKHWHNIVNKVGYVIEVIIDNLTWGDALKKEVEFIAIYKRKIHGGILINLTDGGEGNTGYVTSDETKKKQSLLKIGKPSPSKGKPMHPNAMAALKKANKGRVSWNKGLPMAQSAKDKRAKSIVYKKGEDHPMYGKPMLETTKQKLIEANKNRPPWNKGKKMSAEICLKNSLSKKGKPSWNKGKKMAEGWGEGARKANTGKPAWNAGKKMSKEYMETKYIPRPSNVIQQFDRNGMLLNTFSSSKIASKTLGFNVECIRMASRSQFGKKYTNIYKGYAWKQKDP